jgi:pimeloyl-ACP methyl ester carboxylesterase
MLVTLMVDRLGHARFAGRGTDQGGLVQQQMGLRFPERLIGLHRSGISPYATPMPDDLSPAEQAYQEQVAPWVRREQVYAQLHALRPETLTPAIADSPVGFAAWVIEKFQRWGDARGDLDGHFGRDRLLDNITLHWLANTGAASIRLYREWARDPGLTGRVDVPTAFMMPLADGAMVPAPRAWCERFYDVRRFTETGRGGHFPEWETPQVVADDMRAFFAEIAPA